MELSSVPQPDLKTILPMMRLLLRIQEFEFKKHQFEAKQPDAKPKAKAVPPAPPAEPPVSAPIEASPELSNLPQPASQIASLAALTDAQTEPLFHAPSHSCTLLHDNFSNHYAG